MGLQGPGTNQGVIERKVHCKLANEVTRYHEKITGGWLLEFLGTFYRQLSKNGSQFGLNVLKESHSNTFSIGGERVTNSLRK